tara:strand:- start:134 stop:442 length:309 start_codon:yes stop_codon:yes gene_type:complete
MKKFVTIIAFCVLFISCESSDSDSGCGDAGLKFKNNTPITLTLTTNTNGIKTINAGQTYTLVLVSNTRVEYSGVAMTSTAVHRWNNVVTVKDCEIRTINLSF